jgi:hypothetical protein
LDNNKGVASVPFSPNNGESNIAVNAAEMMRQKDIQNIDFLVELKCFFGARACALVRVNLCEAHT